MSHDRDFRAEEDNETAVMGILLHDLYITEILGGFLGDNVTMCRSNLNWNYVVDNFSVRVFWNFKGRRNPGRAGFKKWSYYFYTFIVKFFQSLIKNMTISVKKLKKFQTICI